MDLHQLITGLSPALVYLVVGALVGIESIGVPLPGETALITAALLAAQPGAQLSIEWIALAAVTGAVVGDNIGYLAGRELGTQLLDAISRRFPKQVSAAHLGYARHLFSQWGMPTVFFGRFVALLRMLAGPLAGSMHLTWPRFLVANLAGGVLWAGGITLVTYYAGNVAHTYLKDFAWVALAVVVVAAVLLSRTIHRRFEANVAAYARDHGLDAGRPGQSA